jgi:site-specific recombinase XerD
MIEKSDLTIDELINLYEISTRAEGKSPRTIEWYIDILKPFAVYLRSKLNQNDIHIFTKDNIRGYILYLHQRPRFQGHRFTPSKGTLSAKTVQGHVRALKVFSSWLYSEGYTEDNRLGNLKLPKAPQKEIEPLTHQEIKQIDSDIDHRSPVGFRNHAIFITALDTGLRVSEIAGISLNKIDLQTGCMKVMGKGSKERTVPIGKLTAMTLQYYITNIRPTLNNLDCNSLFLSRVGAPITANTIKLFFSRLAKVSGIRRLHAHLCRHTFAINYLLNGGDIFSLRGILGHTTLEMVNHYIHFTSSQITEQHHKYSPMDRFQREEKELLGNKPANL